VTAHPTRIILLAQTLQSQRLNILCLTYGSNFSTDSVTNAESGGLAF
jgi:hypothetical protein